MLTGLNDTFRRDRQLPTKTKKIWAKHTVTPQELANTDAKEWSLSPSNILARIMISGAFYAL